jgi:hypothetical protein
MRGGHSTTSRCKRGATREALARQERGIRCNERGVDSTTSQQERGTTREGQQARRERCDGITIKKYITISQTQ